MRPPRDRDTLVRVARMYFEQDLSQQEIAEALNTTRSNVSRILAAARRNGIVQIRIVKSIERADDLEAQLCERFGLREALVLASSRVGDGGGVGGLGAEWLAERIQPGFRVALSWGSTLHAMVRAMSSIAMPDVEVVQLVGGLSALASEVSGQELVRELSERLHCRYRYLHAPALFGSSTGLRAMLAEPAVAEALDLARKADIAVVGIGAVGVGSSAEILDSLNLSARELKAFQRGGPVGDVCARYYDAEGTAVDSVVAERVLAVDLDDLRGIDVVAGIASGAGKGKSLAAALRGGLVDVPICDAAAARAGLAAAEG